MKNRLLILFVLIFFSCNNQKEFDLYINQIYELNDVIKFHNDYDQTFEKIEKKLNDLDFGNPAPIKYWYDKAIKIDNLSSDLIEFVDSLNKIYVGDIKDSSNLNLSKVFEPKDKELLTNSLIKYLQELDSIYKDEKPQGFEHMSIYGRNILNIDSIPLNTNSQKVYKIHTVLLQIINSIYLIKENHFNLLYSFINYHGHSIHDIESLVIPEKVKINKEEKYCAEIYFPELIYLDSISRFHIFVEDKELKKNQDNYHFYKEKADGPIGYVTKEGYRRVINSATGDTVIFPFKIEYEIIK